MAASIAARSTASPRLDGIAIERGNSTSSHCDVTLTRVSVQRRLDAIQIQNDHGTLTCYWDLGLGVWKNDASSATHKRLVDVGLTPVFRYEFNSSRRLAPYVEAGIGAHFLSHSSVGPSRRFGSAFQFGDHAGAGVRFGERGRYDLSYRFQHLSNAGLQPPNQGINYHIVRLGLHF